MEGWMEGGGERERKKSNGGAGVVSERRVGEWGERTKESELASERSRQKQDCYRSFFAPHPPLHPSIYLHPPLSLLLPPSPPSPMHTFYPAGSLVLFKPTRPL